MCGLAGWVGGGRKNGVETADCLLKALRHRGPDAQGLWVDKDGAVGMVHTRLSIIDTDPRSNQPLSRASRYHLVFNGEIYNYRQLRAQLESAGEEFSTESDTEVLLAAYAAWGVEMLDRLRGMYAFALWDNSEETLLLARDPLGIKPLYYSAEGEGICFSSELRALIRGRLVSPEIDRWALFHYLRRGSYQQPETPLRGVHMLGAGDRLVWSRGRFTQSHATGIGVGTCTSEAPEKDLRTALIESVESHLVSDVPVGLFLSAGIDSSLIALICSQIRSDPPQALTLAFPGSGHDESVEAARWAKALGLRHVTWTPSDKDIMGLAHDYFGQVDQPGIDGFNTFCISSLAAREGCKVVLSGLGGDELFGGYPSFRRLPELMRWHSYARMIPYSSGILEQAARWSGQPRLLRLAEFFQGAGSWNDAHRAFRGIFTSQEALLIMKVLGYPTEIPANGEPEGGIIEISDPVAALEINRYMRNQLLRDSDSYSMAHGVELRLPLVDEVLYRKLLPMDSTWRHRPGKQAIHDAFPELPEWLTKRRKTGFSLPYDRWFDTILAPLESAIPGSLAGCMNTWYRRMSLLSFLRWKEINLPGP